jgi:hypothetical protein
MESLIAALIAVIVPAAATYLVVQVAKLNALIDKLPGVIKQVVVVVVAYLFTIASSKLGIAFPPGLAGFADPTVLSGALSGIMAWLVHKWFKPAS